MLRIKNFSAIVQLLPGGLLTGELFSSGGGGYFPGGYFPGGLLTGAIFQGGYYPGGGGLLTGGYSPDGECPGAIDLESSICPQNWVVDSF